MHPTATRITSKRVHHSCSLYTRTHGLSASTRIIQPLAGTSLTVIRLRDRRRVRLKEWLFQSQLESYLYGNAHTARLPTVYCPDVSSQALCLVEIDL